MSDLANQSRLAKASSNKIQRALVNSEQGSCSVLDGIVYVGSLDWARYEVVLDMAPDSRNLALGLILDGPGKVWMEEPQLEIVDESVPVTDLKRTR